MSASLAGWTATCGAVASTAPRRWSWWPWRSAVPAVGGSACRSSRTPPRRPSAASSPRSSRPGAVVHTDGWNGYRRLRTLGYNHRPRSQRTAGVPAADLDEILPRVHRVISNLKSWLQGTHRGVSREHLQVYLDEYVFRFNRRRTPMAAFQTLLGLGSQQPPTTYRDIYAEGPGKAAAPDPSLL